MSEKFDPVERPAHYTARGGIDTREFIQSNGLGFCEGSIIKYVRRWREKNGLEDLRKARNFLDFLIESAERERDGGQMVTTTLYDPSKAQPGSEFYRANDNSRGRACIGCTDERCAERCAGIKVTEAYPLQAGAFRTCNGCVTPAECMGNHICLKV